MATLHSINFGNEDNANSPLLTNSLLGASNSVPLKVWISSILYTGETVTKEGVDYKKCKLRLSATFDLVNSQYNHVYYEYKVNLTDPTWSMAITENSEIDWNFTGGTSEGNSGIPTTTISGVSYPAVSNIVSDVYVPAETCSTQAFLRGSVDDTTGEVFDRSLFIYSRKGSLRASDEVVTGYGVVKSNNVVSANFGSAQISLTSATPVINTVSTTAAAVEAKLNAIKANKVSSATNGNFAGLDASGNLTDSGKTGASFVQTSGQSSQSVEGQLSVGSLYVGGTKVEVVTAVPTSPIADTLYFVTGS